MSSRRRPTCTRCRANIRCCGARSTRAGCPSRACSKRCSLSSAPAPTASSRTSRWMLPKPCGVRSALLFMSWFIGAAALAAYPEKPIRFVIPSAAGGSPDVLMRVMTQQLSTQIGVPFVVENKPGASFTLGTMDVVKAAPDGYTLGYGNIVSLAINRSLLEKVPYDVERELTLVSNCVRVFNLLALNNKLPVRSVQELIDYAKKNPGRLVMASGGNGTTGHLGGELFKAMTGTFILHVPYRGSPQAINDLIAGEVHLMFDNISSIGAHARAGRVRGIAVSGPRRSPLFPDLPTLNEAGVTGYETVAWGGVIAPANLPREIVAPGFIDAHTHDDRLMLSAPEMAPKVSQGVTTVVAGNCGISLAPAPRGMNAPVLPPIDLLDDAGGWFRFPTFHSYVEELRAHPASANCALLVGHTMLRAQTMGDVGRPAGKEEIAK